MKLDYSNNFVIIIEPVVLWENNHVIALSQPNYFVLQVIDVGVMALDMRSVKIKLSMLK